jgi:hypothetical protein
MHWPGFALFGLELGWHIYWFILVIFFNSQGGQTFTLEQGLFDQWFRIVGVFALGHILHKTHRHHEKKKEKHMHWTYFLVLFVVAAISCRGVVRLFTYYGGNFVAAGGVNQVHMNLLTSVIWISFGISMLEVLWMWKMVWHIMGHIGVPGLGFSFVVNFDWLFGGKHHEYKKLEEERRHVDIMDVDSSIRSTPHTGLRQNKYGV